MIFRSNLMYFFSIVVLGVFLSISIVHAADSGGYVGISVGEAEVDTISETDSALKLFGGYQFNQNFAIEAAYVDFGKFVSDTVSVDGLALDVVGLIPVGNSFSLFAKYGVFSWEAKDAVVSFDGDDPTYGFGGEYMFADNFAGRVEYENFTDIAGSDISLISLGVSYTF